MSTDITIIQREIEVTKILAFIRARVSGKKFQIVPEVLESVLQQLEDWSRVNDVRVTLRIVRADVATVLVLGACGASAGAIAGLLIAGTPAGVVIGAIGGAAAGVLAAHVHISIRMGHSPSDRALLELV